MIDRPLVRREHPIDPRLDQWMLDRWSSPAQHVVTVCARLRYMPDGHGGMVPERDYRAVCSCGWRSIETTSPQMEACPVSEALVDRVRRIRKPTERLHWVPLVEPDPRD